MDMFDPNEQDGTPIMDTADFIVKRARLYREFLGSDITADEFLREMRQLTDNLVSMVHDLLVPHTSEERIAYAVGKANGELACIAISADCGVEHFDNNPELAVERLKLIASRAAAAYHELSDAWNTRP